VVRSVAYRGGMATTHRLEVEAILAGARAEHRALLSQLSPELGASLPVDATGITQAIDHLAVAGGLPPEDVHGEQVRAHRTNAAVLHGRVFGRAPLGAATVLAAFVDGARVRADALMRLASALGGPELEDEVAELVAFGDVGSPARLRELYAAHERAALAIAAHLDRE
jgi:hypothetical protein